MSRTPTGSNPAPNDDRNDSPNNLRRVSTSREMRPAMDPDNRPSFLHRSHSHLHDYRQGIKHLFQPKTNSTSQPNILSSAKKVEEEANPKYRPDAFYPAKIDEILDTRYKLLAKLGFGMTATVWLAKDLHATPSSARKLVTIKINVNTLPPEHFKSRRQISEKLATSDPNHPGYNHVRFSLNSFKIKGPRHGLDRSPEHLCVVYDVLREPIDQCMKKWPSGRFNGPKLRLLLPSLLLGLDYMHSAGVVHTDLKADNIMMGLGDPLVLERFIQGLVKNPPARKMPDHHGRIIYESRSDFGAAPTEEVIKSAKITDIGLAEWGDQLNNKPIQSNAFTAPEVLLTAGWSYPADIWNLGVMLWDIVGEEGLFDEQDTEPGNYRSTSHLGLMIGLLGPPPKELLERGSTTATYFDENGEFRKPSAVKAVTWARYLKKHLRGEELELFIDFAQKMIRWLPEDRWTAKQLLQHPFLTKTEFAIPDSEDDVDDSVNLIEKFAVTKPRSNTMTPQPTPSPPGDSPPGPSPENTPAPSIKSLAVNGRSSTVSSFNSGMNLNVTSAPLARSSSNISTRSCNMMSQDLIDSILKAKPKSGTSTPAIKEEPDDLNHIN